MTRAIGQAIDFYRLRLTRLEVPSGLDFEWRDDILYRRPPTPEPHEKALWVLEAVELASTEKIHRIGAYPSRDDAQASYEAVLEVLNEATRSEFERAYIELAIQDDASSLTDS